MVAVVAGAAGYFAYLSSQKNPSPIVTQTMEPTLEAGLATTPALTKEARAVGRTWRVSQDYPAIDEAIAAASPGDIIQVGPGTYPGFRIDKTLILKGSGVDRTIVRSPVKIATGDMNLTGFTIEAAADGPDVFDGELTSIVGQVSVGIFGGGTDNTLPYKQSFRQRNNSRQFWRQHGRY